MAAPKAANQKKTAADASGKKKAAKKQLKTEDDDFNYIVRLVNTDIDGQKHTAIGLQSIKGVGKRVAQIVVSKSGVNPSTKIGTLSDEEVARIEKTLMEYVDYAPSWAINRRMDYETGDDMHLFGNDLSLMGTDDVNRLKMIRSYRGVRHEGNHKVRGQKTRTNGRQGLAVGVQKKS